VSRKVPYTFAWFAVPEHLVFDEIRPEEPGVMAVLRGPALSMYLVIAAMIRRADGDGSTSVTISNARMRGWVDKNRLEESRDLLRHLGLISAEPVDGRRTAYRYTILPPSTAEEWGDGAGTWSSDSGILGAKIESAPVG
jgi:hypothetical protein